MADASGVLEVRLHPRHGRGLFTTRAVRGGEVVLREAPLFVAAAAAEWDCVCATCLRTMSGGATCGGCCFAAFCSAECQAAAHSTPWVHSPGVCRAYKALKQEMEGGQLDDMQVDAGRFLAVALAAKAAAADDAGCRYALLLALQGEAGPVEARLAAELQPLLTQALGPEMPALQPGELATLLRKEQCNSYGICMPFAAEDQAQDQAPTDMSMEEAAEDEDETTRIDRPLRGSALYARASLINHECNPNVVRFDNFEGPAPANTHVEFRAMHDLPAGTEVLQSYCPIAWDYVDRQEHCSSVYGFTCACQRCQLEATWQMPGGAADNDDEEGQQQGMPGLAEAPPHSALARPPAADCMAIDSSSTPLDPHIPQPAPLWSPHPPTSGGATPSLPAAALAALVAALQPVGPAPLPIASSPTPEGAGSGDAGAAAEEAGPLDPTYLQLYLLKYVCAAPDCQGSMAPRAAGEGVLECCVCGALRSEQAFLADLDEAAE